MVYVAVMCLELVNPNIRDRKISETNSSLLSPEQCAVVKRGTLFLFHPSPLLINTHTTPTTINHHEHSTIHRIILQDDRRAEKHSRPRGNRLRDHADRLPKDPAQKRRPTLTLRSLQPNTRPARTTLPRRRIRPTHPKPARPPSQIRRINSTPSRSYPRFNTLFGTGKYIKPTKTNCALKHSQFTLQSARIEHPISE